MSYNVGTQIDLAQIKTENERANQATYKKPRFNYDAGTQIIFRFVNGQLITARKINVAFA
jgi:hypothetical protein